MNQLMIFVCVGAGLFFAALAWVLAALPGAPVPISADMLSRSAGVALLGFVLIATGAVFRSALAAEQKPASGERGPRSREYRRGFRERAVRTHAQSWRDDSVPTLRCAVLKHGQMPVQARADTTLAMADLERLHDLLQRRAAQTNARNGRRDVQNHDLASPGTRQ
jgi:hypothetical protein